VTHALSGVSTPSQSEHGGSPDRREGYISQDVGDGVKQQITATARLDHLCVPGPVSIFNMANAAFKCK
jgi:hypothetical protein